MRNRLSVRGMHADVFAPDDTLPPIWWLRDLGIARQPWTQPPIPPAVRPPGIETEQERFHDIRGPVHVDREYRPPLRRETAYFAAAPPNNVTIKATAALR
jgi:hypothetical protein